MAAVALPVTQALPDFLPAPPPGFRPIISAPLDRPVGIVSRDPFDPDVDHVAPAIWREDWRGWVLAADRDALCHEPHGWREIAAGTWSGVGI